MLGAEFRNGFFGSRLLAAKLVAGKTEDREAVATPALVERFEAPILGRIAAAARCVDNQEHFASKFLEIDFCAFDIRDFYREVDFHRALYSRAVFGTAMNCSRLLVSRAGGRHRDTLWLGRVVGSPAHFSGSGGQNIELGPKGKRGDVFGPVFGHDQDVMFAITAATRF